MEPRKHEELGQGSKVSQVQTEEAPQLASQLDPLWSNCDALRCPDALLSLCPRCPRTGLILLALPETQRPEDPGQSRDLEFLLSPTEMARGFTSFGERS